MKYKEFLGRRSSTFLMSLQLCKKLQESKQVLNIVELGTTRSFGGNGSYSNNYETWDWGAGCFTKVFADNLPECKIHTVDPCPNAINISKTICQNNDNVFFYKKTAKEFLKEVNFKIDFLYMDHLESHDRISAIQASLEHLHDIDYIMNNNLMAEKCLILHDDFDHGNIISKSQLSVPYLKLKEFKELIVEYQNLMANF